MRGWRTILGCLAIMSCTPIAAPVAPPMAGPDDCKASELQGLVGQDQGRLAVMKFAGPVRIIQPGMAVTMDFNPARLNIEIDAQGRISRVSCG